MNRIWLRLWLGMVAAGFSVILAMVITTLVVRSLFDTVLQQRESVATAIILAGIVVLGSALTMGVAAYLAWQLARPLMAVSKAARLVAEGDLSARVQTKSRGKDEITQLLHDFNGVASSREKLETERKSTTAIIAHELRTPMTVLQGRLAALRDGVFEVTPAEIAILLQQTEMLTRLVEDLRVLSLVEVGKMSLELAEVNLTQLIKDVVLGFEPQATTKGVRLEVCTPYLFTLRADATRLQQIVSNLLDNAIKFTPRGGRVQLGLAQKELELVLTIRDTGSGISEESLSRMFDRFYQGDTRGIGGSGLGLAVVKSLVDLHGGRVSVVNHAEGGAVFCVFLPGGVQTKTDSPMALVT
jgi:two-component system, OmpR family, sensor histidine kinase BaeS